MDNPTLIRFIQSQSATAARIEQKVDDLHAQLFGNGTGNGAIRFIHDEAKDLDKRVDKLEKKQAYFAGIGTALGVAAGIVGDHLKTFLFHHL